MVGHHHHDGAGSSPEHGPSGEARRERGAERRGLLAALGTTSVILIAEAVGGWWSNSLALMADAGHMLHDALALGLAYAAIVFATRPATRRKTFGWYRLEILAALVNGVALVVISLFIVWEAWERWAEPPMVDTGLMMVVALVGLAANGLGLFFLSGHGHSLNMRGAFLHVLGDLLSSVAVVAGGVVMWWTDMYWIDPLLSGLISVVIVYGAWRLLRESVDVLLEGTPQGIDHEEVEHAILEVDGVLDVHDLHIWSLTSGMVSLSCHVEVEEERLGSLGRLLDEVRHVLQERFAIVHTTIQVEPEDYQRRGMVRWHLGGRSSVG